MIHIDKLDYPKDIGRCVIYTDGVGEQQQGRIKSWNDKWIFVVYHCANNWSQYQDYTAAATNPKSLDFRVSLDWDPDTTRFDLIDFD